MSKVFNYLKPFAVVALLIFGWSEYVEACIEPTSDEELATNYYICDGGWCLR